MRALGGGAPNDMVTAGFHGCVSGGRIASACSLPKVLATSSLGHGDVNQSGLHEGVKLGVRCTEVN